MGDIQTDRLDSGVPRNKLNVSGVLKTQLGNVQTTIWRDCVKIIKINIEINNVSGSPTGSQKSNKTMDNKKQQITVVLDDHNKYVFPREWTSESPFEH